MRSELFTYKSVPISLMNIQSFVQINDNSVITEINLSFAAFSAWTRWRPTTREGKWSGRPHWPAVAWWQPTSRTRSRRPSDHQPVAGTAPAATVRNRSVRMPCSCRAPRTAKCRNCAPEIRPFHEHRPSLKIKANSPAASWGGNRTGNDYSCKNHSELVKNMEMEPTEGPS